MLKLSNKIKLVASDFDGVFTDGSVYISEKNDVQKKLNFKDIMGVSLIVKARIDFAIISGEKSTILDYFKEKFNLKEIHGGIRQKGIVLADIMERYDLKRNEVLYIGDDINDIPAFELTDYKIAPRNCNPALPYMVSNLQITKNTGGYGAIREIADILTSSENADKIY